LLASCVRFSTQTVIILVIFVCLFQLPYVPAHLSSATDMPLNQRIGNSTPTQFCNIHKSFKGEGFTFPQFAGSLQSYDNPKAQSFTTGTDPLAITITPLQQPPSTLERTARANASYVATYPNGTFVVTSKTAFTHLVSRGAAIAQVPLVLTNATTGVWTTNWISSYSANLTAYHFELNPADFKDAYGNSGQGATIVSSDFTLIPASVTLQIRAVSPLPRRENESIVIPALYHDGSSLQNITRLKAGIVDANGTARPLNLTSIGELPTGYFDPAANANLGVWKIVANFTDEYGNSGKGFLQFEVVKTHFAFSVYIPQPVQRTTKLNVTVNVSYLDGKPLTGGVSGNITIGNFTQSLGLVSPSQNQTWVGGEIVSQNATLGNYNVTIVAADPYGNERNFTEPVTIIPAAFIFSLPSQYVQVNPLELKDVAVSVTYPNGTALKDNVGVASVYFTNSTGGLSKEIMQFNSTDSSWHIFFTAPDQRFKLFNTVIVFSFEAKDIFGNYGYSSNAYSMTVTTPPTLLIISAIIGLLIPIGLLTWAMITVSQRRRKHKP